MVDARVARQSGVISGAVVDPDLHRVVALDIHHGDGYVRERIPADAVRHLGASAVLVENSQDLEFLEPEVDHERWIPLDRLTGLAVLSQEGDHLGTIVDVTVDRGSLAVLLYNIRPTFWEGLAGLSTLVPTEIAALSQDVVIVGQRRPPNARQRLVHSLRSRADRVGGDG